jgi:hypothetical protein
MAAIGLVVAVQAALAIDVNVDVDKTFDFSRARSWGWKPEGAGEIRMARTQLDDPDAVRQQAEPVIIAAVTSEMERRGLQRTDDAPDLVLTYFLLLSTNLSGQEVGQFLPSTTAWALPPFTRGTQSLKYMNRGSLVLDVTGGHDVVWRGVAQANIDVDADTSKRETLLRQAIRDLMRRFPRRG